MEGWRRESERKKGGGGGRKRRIGGDGLGDLDGMWDMCGLKVVLGLEGWGEHGRVEVCGGMTAAVAHACSRAWCKVDGRLSGYVYLL